MTTSNTSVAVFGGYGHTARFVLAELSRHGLTPVLSGRDADRLRKAASEAGLSPDTVRVATAEDPDALDAALAGTAAVLNCAGPFADTAPMVAAAAIRAGIHYLDIGAEQVVALRTLTDLDEAATRAGVVVAPSVSFYGGLGDLLATAAMGDWPAADAVEIAIVLDSWLPTEGTRRTISRNAGRHLAHEGGELVPPPSTPGTREFRDLTLTELSTADQVTIGHHLRVGRIAVHMNARPLDDLADPATPAPAAVDERGRSAQTFLVDVTVTRDGQRRRVTASGQDIYAVTAPLLVGVAVEVLTGRFDGPGARTAAQLVEPTAFLRSLDPEHLRFSGSVH
ncbi:saccharopine dehydrogenase family protein [Actinophytocola xanthii]|uniref:saccharopine dehydrogenase family protein n=1 Tax=Actinophytocola xanthii TaxID=1912961 RepID=UPI0009FB2E84|nr:saccharopine dehydrogenase NADP-binding domain-containing protein [Actinophytocola xanthii]